MYGNKTTNRKLSSFAYSKMKMLAYSKTVKYNIFNYAVNPAFTSFIAKIKYMKKLGLSIHSAAAIVIGRRAMNFKENVPKEYLKYISPKTRVKHHWAHFRYLSTKLKSIKAMYFYTYINTNPYKTLAKLSNNIENLDLKIIKQNC